MYLAHLCGIVYQTTLETYSLDVYLGLILKAINLHVINIYCDAIVH